MKPCNRADLVSQNPLSFRPRITLSQFPEMSSGKLEIQVESEDLPEKRAASVRIKQVIP